MKHIVRVLLAQSFLLFVALPCLAGQVDFDIYVGRVSPFTVVSEAEKVTGAAVDVVEIIMERAGNPIDTEEIQSISWARAIFDVENISKTMIFCVARTAQREDKFKWVGPVAELNLGLVAKREPRIEIRDKADLHEYRIGAVRNSGPAQILETVYQIPIDELTLLSNDTLQFKMLESGRVDLITQADTAAPAWLTKLGLDQADYEMVHVMKRLKLYVAFNKSTDQALIDRIQAALDDLKKRKNGRPSEYQLIMKEYLGAGPIPMQ